MKATHLTFSNAYIKSPDHVSAYKSAFPKVSDKVAATKGKLLLKRPDVAKFIGDEQAKIKALYDQYRQEALQKMAAEDVASDFEIKSILTGIVRKKKVKPDPNAKKIIYPSYQEQIRAAEVLNSMCGYDAPKRIDATIQTMSVVTKDEETKQALENLR